jgi:hypothetical protein
MAGGCLFEGLLEEDRAPQGDFPIPDGRSVGPDSMVRPQLVKKQHM